MDKNNLTVLFFYVPQLFLNKYFLSINYFIVDQGQPKYNSFNFFYKSIHMTLSFRAGHSRFFRAFALASAKLKKARKREEKKARKKRKRRARKKKSANSRFFLSLPSIALEARFQGPTWPTCGGGDVGLR